MKKHIKEKVRQTKEDEKLYRRYRYQREAVPIILTITLFTLLQTLIVMSLLSLGVGTLLAPVISVLISSSLSYPVYSDIKTEMASKGKAFLEENKILRENDVYTDNLYPHFDSEASSLLGAREWKSEGRNNVITQESSSFHKKQSPDTTWQEYLDLRDSLECIQHVDL
ncbi:MAG: hypothetical protein HON23_01895 [Rickettsiales bacterium]|nr:hypothetical protein [Rickettsiales bacterium]